MKKTHKQVTVYLSDTAHAGIQAASRANKRSLSGHIKYLIDSEISGAGPPSEELLEVQKKILIGVDALLKYHDNDKVFGIVKATRNARFGVPSDEA